MKLKDADIRSCLYEHLKDHFSYDPSTLIVDELCIAQGDARVDVAVINGSLHGYEIKSEADTLDRLERQREIYAKGFDFLTIVTGENHLRILQRTLPRWWGICVAKQISNSVVLKVVRQAKKNPSIDPYTVAQLLWKAEVIKLLRSKGKERGLSSKPRQFLWDLLTQNMTIDELASAVRETLKERQSWRADLLQTPSGVM